jgi:hypothetical protein
VVLRGNFGPKRDEVIGKWIKLYSEKLNDLYCSSSIVRVKSLPHSQVPAICLYPEPA